MRDFNRIERAGKSGWTEHGPFEAEQFFGEGEEWSAGPAGETFGEADGWNSPVSLLEVTSDAELDGVLRDLIGRVGQAVSRIISAPEEAQWQCPERHHEASPIRDRRRHATESRPRVQLELEGLSNGIALKSLGVQLTCRRGGPESHSHRPVLASGRGHGHCGGGRPRRPTPSSAVMERAWNHAFATNPASPLTESEFDLTLGARPKPLPLRFMDLRQVYLEMSDTDARHQTKNRAASKGSN